MSTVTNNTTSNPLSSSATSTTSGSTATTTDGSATASTFLTLLVAQMQNQDPTNPMDDSQITSQMAQINTVTQLSSLNTSITGLSSQYSQMQAIQAASLVGSSVIVPGNQLSVTNSVGAGGFSLTTPADDVRVAIVNAAGATVDTVDLGKQAAGQGSFNWDASKAGDTTGYTFKVTATAGGQTLASTALMRDTVVAVNTSSSTLTLELANSGDVPYSQVQALN